MAKAEKSVKVDPNKQAVEELKKCIDGGHSWGTDYLITYNNGIGLECRICGYKIKKWLPQKMAENHRKSTDKIVKYVKENW